MNYQVPTHVHFREVHDEIVILDERSDAYWGLNDTAAVVWSALAEGRDVDVVVEELVDRFQVSHEMARSDVSDLVEEFVGRGLMKAL